MKMVTPMDLKANGHYTPGVLAGGMLYISGQLPIEPVTGQIINGDAGEQCQRALFNLDKVLMSAGLSRDAVVSVHIYAADIQDWDNSSRTELVGKKLEKKFYQITKDGQELLSVWMAEPLNPRCLPGMNSP